MGRVDTPITKPLPYFGSFFSFWKKNHDHGWTKWKFTIVLGIPKKKEQQQKARREWACSRRKIKLDPLTFKSHIFIIPCLFWTILKLWKHHLKLYKTFLKFKGNRKTSKDLKLQNANWSYVQTHMPINPFTRKRHNLFISSSIWGIFVALDPLGEGLQIFLSFKGNKTIYKDL